MSTDNQMAQPNKPRGTEQQIQSLGKIIQNLREEETIDVLITTLVTYLVENFGYQFIWVGFYDQVTKKVHGNGGITPDGDNSCLQRSVLVSSGSLICQVISELCPVGVTNLRGDVRAPEWQEIAAEYHIQGTIILPIRYKNNCLGVILLGSQRWGYLLSEETRAKLLIVVGELGVVLEQHLQQQRSLDNPQNSATEPLLELLEDLRSLNYLDKKLEAVVQATDKFVSPSRTSIYWFDREGNYFWCRMNSQLVNIGRDWGNRQTSAGITAQELSDVYYALAVNQVVWLSESNSSIKSHIQAKLLQRLGVESLLAAPIIWKKDLLGFVAVESNKPKNWHPVEKNLVQGAAGLLSLVFPLNTLEPTQRQIQTNYQLSTKFAHLVHQEEEIETALYDCATELLEKLNSTGFCLLEYDHSRDIYQNVQQVNLNNRRIGKFTPTPLSEMDSYLLENTHETIEVSALENDLRFLNWHSELLESGVRSLLICNCIQNQQPNILMIITNDSNHSWTNLQKELCWVISQYIGVIVRNEQLNIISAKQQEIAQIFKQYPTSLIKSEINTTELNALQNISEVLDSSLAIILTWKPGDKQARIIHGVANNYQFNTVESPQILIDKDVLIELALAHNSYLILDALDIPAETKEWLTIPDNGRILIMALRATEDSLPTGIVLLADYAGEHWSELKLSIVASLISQLAWWQGQNIVSQSLTQKTQVLQQLNWYKHRRLHDIHRMSASVLKQIINLGIPSNELTKMRYKLLLRQLNYINNSMKGVIQKEQWQLRLSSETMSVSDLLKRCIDRVDSFAKQQQIWIGVHGLTEPINEVEKSQDSNSEKTTTPKSSALATVGDIIKIELVIYELLLNACKRSPVGDRIDIWCQPLNDFWLEISITDNGKISPQLLAELNQEIEYKFLNLLSKRSSQPPGLHLLICQQIIKQLEGTLQIYEASDNRIVSRLVLPLVSDHIEGNTFGSTTPLI